MSTTIHSIPADETKLWQSMTQEEFRAEFLAALGTAIVAIVRIAQMVRFAEENGMDLGGTISTSHLNHLRRIAHGQELPEIYANFRGRPDLHNRASKLPMPEQHRLVNDIELPVVIIKDGARDVRMIKPSLMDREKIMQVFAADHIRTEAEQIIYLDRLCAAKGTRTIGNIVYERGEIRVTAGCRLTKAQIIAILSKM